MLHHRWIAILLLALAGGCESRAPVAELPRPRSKPAVSVPAQPAPATENAMNKGPFLFDEAKLPAGFPAPGPVGKVIVKTYPPSRAAITRGDNQNRMFEPLFNHIQKHDIAMSAPVEITWSEPPSNGGEAQPVAMAFVYRDPNMGKPGADGPVDVVDMPAQLYLSVGVRGSYNREHLDAGLQQLRAWLATHPNDYKVIGPPRYLGYNSPFVPWFMRYGEVQLPIAAATTRPALGN